MLYNCILCLYPTSPRPPQTCFIHAKARNVLPYTAGSWPQSTICLARLAGQEQKNAWLPLIRDSIFSQLAYMFFFTIEALILLMWYGCQEITSTLRWYHRKPPNAIYLWLSDFGFYFLWNGKFDNLESLLTLDKQHLPVSTVYGEEALKILFHFREKDVASIVMLEVVLLKHKSRLFQIWVLFWEKKGNRIG